MFGTTEIVESKIKKIPECEVCGCLVNEYTAHCEKSVEEEEYFVWDGYFKINYAKRDKIIKKYYCKLHKPKK